MSRPEGGYSRRNLGGSERVVMNTLGIDVDATAGDNLRTFKRMNKEVNVFAKSGRSKRQSTNGQDGCAQLMRSTHKGIN